MIFYLFVKYFGGFNNFIFMDFQDFPVTYYFSVSFSCLVVACASSEFCIKFKSTKSFVLFFPAEPFNIFPEINFSFLRGFFSSSS